MWNSSSTESSTTKLPPTSHKVAHRPADGAQHHAVATRNQAHVVSVRRRLAPRLLSKDAAAAEAALARA